jgi:hypothetical protein
MLEGSIIRAPYGGTFTFPNNAGQAAQVQTITPGAADTNATTYILLEQTTGQSVTFVSGASPTAAQVVTGLKAALALNPVLSGLAVYTGTTTLIATSRQTGAGATPLSFVDGGSTPTNTLSVAATTAGTDPSVIYPGRGLVVSSTGVISLPSGSSFTFAGVSGVGQTDNYSNDYPGAIDGLYGLPNNPSVGVKRGEVAVKFLTAANPTSTIYMVYSGSTAGQFAGSSVANSSSVAAFARCLDVVVAGGIGRLGINMVG